VRTATDNTAGNRVVAYRRAADSTLTAASSYASVAVHGDLVYVLNALNGGSVQGYRVLGSFLAPFPARTARSAWTRTPPRSSPPRPGRSPSSRTAPSSRRRFEAHLAGCPHCTEYLAQMRETISLTGRLEPEDLTPQMRDEFTDLYRRWRSEHQ
jgi:hypothetical protein